MVQVTFVDGHGRKRKLHWPRDFSVEAMQPRICWAFSLSCRQFRAHLSYEGHCLQETSLPFICWARRSKSEMGVAFVARPASEAERLQYFAADDDISSGISTPSACEAQMGTLDLCRD